MSTEIYTAVTPIPVATAEPIGVELFPQENPSIMESLNEDQISKLIEQGYTKGLVKSLQNTKEAFEERIWIIDNSGSMQQIDGHRIVETCSRNFVKMVPCSRLEEIRECISYHVQLASTIKAPTSFRFLNNPGAHVGPQRFEVSKNPASAVYEVREALKIMQKVRPGGCTPLVNHILDIQAEVSQIATKLRQNGKRVAIIIATDGLPTDERGYGGTLQQNQFVESLRRLEGLPVWVVVRLCTDDEDVVSFYNELDSVLELSVEVLDDFSGEAQEVYEKNPWLNYALPLHRMREMGYHDRIFDMLDERSLTKSELRDFCVLLFGEENFDGVPDPSLDWEGFTKSVEKLLKTEKPQWDPVKKRMKPWIDFSYLNWTYGESSCTIL